MVNLGKVVNLPSPPPHHHHHLSHVATKLVEKQWRQQHEEHEQQ
jgi:hypothetical protein